METLSRFNEQVQAIAQKVPKNTAPILELFKATLHSLENLGIITAAFICVKEDILIYGNKNIADRLSKETNLIGEVQEIGKNSRCQIQDQDRGSACSDQMSISFDPQDPGFKRWTSICFALRRLKMKFLDKIVLDLTKKYHKALMTRIEDKIGCKPDCSRQTLFSAKHTYMHKYKTRCHDHRTHIQLPNCHNCIVTEIANMIKSDHIYGRLSFRGTDPSKWTSNPWEVMKCFSSGVACLFTSSVQNTDPAGLLHILILNRQIASLLGIYQTKIIRSVKQVLEIRNMLFHQPDSNLTENLHNESLKVFKEFTELFSPSPALHRAEIVKEVMKHHSPLTMQLLPSKVDGIVKNQRGRLLYINNIFFKFETTLSQRTSNKDVDAIKKAFQSLRFRITYEENLSAQEMKNYLEDFSKENFDDSETIVILLASHGTSDGMRGTDGAVLKYSSVFKIFSPEDCPRMKTKRKFFCFNGCRNGDKLKAENLNITGLTAETKGIQANVYSPRPQPQPNGSLAEQHEGEDYPMYADAKVVYSCLHGQVSLRDDENDEGSLFLQSWAEYIEERCSSSTSLDIFDAGSVNDKLEGKTGGQQTCSYWQSTSNNKGKDFKKPVELTSRSKLEYHMEPSNGMNDYYDEWRALN